MILAMIYYGDDEDEDEDDDDEDDDDWCWRCIESTQAWSIPPRELTDSQFTSTFVWETSENLSIIHGSQF